MKQEWLKGWKVIMRKTRESCTYDHRIVTYKKYGITGRPKHCGPLAVFKTRQAARKFLQTTWGHSKHSYNLRRIVKCLYKKAKATYLWTNYLSYDCYVPDGTDFAEKVNCLE